MADHSETKRVISIEGAAMVGADGRPGDYSGLGIPNIFPGTNLPRAYRLRRDQPDAEIHNGETRLVRRYLSAPGAGNLAYFMPGISPGQLLDNRLPVVFTEGEFKAIALYRLACHGSDRMHFLPVGLNGIYGWKGTVAKDSDQDGVRRSVKGVIADIDRIAMRGRVISIAYDYDAKPSTRANVSRARTLFAKELLERGAAAVRYVEIPPEANVKGIDDLLALWGPERVLELFDRARSATAKSQGTSAYLARDGRLWRTAVDRHGVETEVPLSNFVAQVIENRLLDNSLQEESQLIYRMRGQVNGSQPIEFDLPHIEFKESDWPERCFGTKDAFTEVRGAEYVRRAISEISLGAPTIVAYGHLGHREIDGRRVYLHGQGAIGVGGAVNGIETSLPKELSRYELRLPTNSTQRNEAIKAALLTRNCAPPAITYPPLATTLRAPLGPASHVLFLMGPTGTLKTGLAGVMQQFFGLSMGWNGLSYFMPLNFSSTANSIAESLFLVKDSLVIVDDFAPHSDPREMARRRGILERIVRDVGNQAGRGRLGLRPGGGVEGRPVHPPRGTVIITGEDIVHGESLLARMLVIEVDPSAVNMVELSKSQRAGEEGWLTMAMGSYIMWLLADFPARLAKFRQRVDALRSKFTAQHRRTPGAAAELLSALEMFLDFAVESDAISSSDRDEIREEAQKALIEVVCAQAATARAANPALRFRELIRTLIGTHRAHILGADGGVPPAADTLGWRRVSASKGDGQWICHGDAIGWMDGGDLCLDPTGAYAAAQKLATEQREPLAVTAQTLRKRLRQAKLLVDVEDKRQRNTVRRTIQGRSIPVLHVVGDFLGKPPGNDVEEDE
jgi:hypothetical protein